MWNWLALATEIIHQAGRGPGLLAACVWELVAAVTELQGVFAHWQVSTVHSHGAAPALCRVIWWISQQHFLFHGPLFLSSAASTSPTKHLHPWGSLEVPALGIRIQNQFRFKAGSDWWLSCSLFVYSSTQCFGSFIHIFTKSHFGKWWDRHNVTTPPKSRYITNVLA